MKGYSVSHRITPQQYAGTSADYLLVAYLYHQFWRGVTRSTYGTMLGKYDSELSSAATLVAFMYRQGLKTSPVSGGSFINYIV